MTENRIIEKYLKPESKKAWRIILENTDKNVLVDIIIAYEERWKLLENELNKVRNQNGK